MVIDLFGNPRSALMTFASGAGTGSGTTFPGLVPPITFS